ncbi:hypothetical protein FOXB_01432 [Fusarium oxysporum f. sp. conglutinans Fo5176]|uniref:Uncharacterized protein n=1 Tax=Fusarium oxysporum (strain Fo5176) TaxID=660025 RepID=F9F4V7_FUSOF|nr:hypothetical protein FOXB_01432 [Fusarium oxysporum f. sp. conglutinans Fo5176]
MCEMETTEVQPRAGSDRVLVDCSPDGGG